MKVVILLTIILVATFGAGAVDVLCPDVIPLRPYTSVFQTAHALTASNLVQTTIPILPIVVAVALLILFTVTILSPHLLPFMSLVPLGSRGSHSRANRRASGGGWKDDSKKQKLTAREQFRVLMQIFGKPKMVIIYEEQKSNDGKG